MKTRLLLVIGLLFCLGQSLFSQTYYHDYQDGLVVFQLKQDVKRILSKDKQVDFKSYELFTDFLKDYDIVEVKQLHPEINDDLLNRTYQIRLADMSKVDDLARKLNTNNQIEYAELKALHRSFFTPNDPLYNQYQWALPKISAPQAWDISFGNSSVVVAVTDGAIQTGHVDLQGVFLTGYDAATGSNNPNPCGSNSGDHGTHVSGIVGANTNNGVGIAAIGGGVKILPVKIGGCSSGNLPYGYDGVVWAANNGAHIINMSWGGSGGGQYGQNVMNNAWNNGVILVAAAGNDGNSSQLYPAAYNNVIAVASTNENDQKSSFSQYGSWINIAAPGSNIASTVGTGYQYMSGTSMASPMVAGLLGLMKSYAPSASRADLINCLYTSADAISDSYYNSGLLGQGRINAYQALNCLTSFNVSYDAAIINIITPTSSICTSTFNPEIELRNNGSITLTSATITYNFGGTPQTYNWTGNLTTGQSTTITLPSQTLPDGSYTFTATVFSPNGQNDQNPSNNTMSSSFTVNGSGEAVVLTLNTDCWGSETTWEIKDDNTNTVVASGGPYTDGANGTQNTHNLCLPAGCYTFFIYDDYGDGMNGAYWGNCSINGYYKMVDSDGTLLFEMTAPNANFGSSTNHSFCVGNNDIEDDAGITEIVSPTGIICSSPITPEVRLKNFGTNPLTSVEIKYQTSGSWQTYNWTGNLANGQTQLVTLPAIAISNGNQTITAKTDNPNGNTDGNTANDESQRDVFISTSSHSLPFVEDFEGNTDEWVVDNPDNSVTWTLATVGGNSPGTTAAKMDFYNYQQSNRRDGLISPRINLTGVSTAQMDFEHAYRRYDQSLADSLIIYVSTDCGSSWQRVIGWAEDGTGTFATQTTNTTPFTPAQPIDWCLVPISGQTPGASCFSVNLDAFVGHNVFIKFESYNAGNTGNNLYIDNINIIGTPSGNPPVPNFDVNTNQVCEGTTIQYTDMSTNNPTSWNWTFPGGTPSTSTSQNPSVTYNTSGTYDVTLEVTNDHGTTTQTFTNEITVNPTPQVNASATSTTICVGQSTTISASGASSYTWNQGLGSGSSHTVSPTTTTTYEVTGTTNGCTNTATITVQVLPAPTVSISASETTVCAGTTVTLTASGASSYTWNQGLGSGATQTVTPTATTTYQVTGANGNCSDVATITINVTPAPTVNLTANTTQICVGESVTLTASGANSYTWNQGLGSGNSHVVNPTTTTTYEVTGTTNGCTNTATITVEVLPAPNVSVSASETTICAGTSVTLTASGASSYTWNQGLGSGATQTVTPATTTTYQVTGANGNCSDVATITINVTPAPTVNLTANTTQICVGESVTLTASGANSYTWNQGLGSGNSHVVNPTTTTTYEVTGTTNGCTNIATITVEVLPAPNVSISASETTICAGTSVTLTASGASSYTWNQGLGSGASQTVTPTTTTTYEVTGANGSCVDTETITINVVPAPNVSITASAINICVGSSVTLTADGATDYTWDNGLGTGSTHVVSPTETTVYTVIGTNGDCSGSSSITIKVSHDPEIEVTAITEELCLGESTIISASGADTYVWSPSMTLSSSSGSTVTATPTTTTTYTVMGSNDCGVASETITIVVLPQPNTPTITQNGNILSVSLSNGEIATWYYNGSLVGTGEVITMSGNGTYEVVITNEDGCQSSASGTFSTTSGLITNNPENLIMIHPNPTSDYVLVSWEGIENVKSIEVYDALGKKVIQLESFMNSQQKVNLGNFETGVYIFRINTSQGVLSKKIIKR